MCFLEAPKGCIDRNQVSCGIWALFPKCSKPGEVSPLEYTASAPHDLRMFSLRYVAGWKMRRPDIPDGMLSRGDGLVPKLLKALVGDVFSNVPGGHELCDGE